MNQKTARKQTDFDVWCEEIARRNATIRDLEDRIAVLHAECDARKSQAVPAAEAVADPPADARSPLDEAEECLNKLHRRGWKMQELRPTTVTPCPIWDLAARHVENCNALATFLASSARKMQQEATRAIEMLAKAMSIDPPVIRGDFTDLGEPAVKT